MKTWQFKVVSFIGILILITLLFVVFGENNNKLENATNYINNLLNSNKNKTMRISGCIVDEKGNSLSDVKVRIEKTKITDIITTISGKDETEIKNIGSPFKLEFTGWHGVSLTFVKDGYHSVKERLDSFSERKEYVKDNVKIVLREIGTLAELIRGEINIVYEKNDDGLIRKTGWVYKERECEKYGIYERVNNIPYDDLSEVDIYAIRAEDGSGLYLIANSEETGFTESVDAPDFTYMPEAPEDGYSSKIKIPYLPVDPDDAERRRSKELFCYFKLKEGLYGKMRIDACEFESGATYRLTCTYYLNPDGSRNLRSKGKR